MCVLGECMCKENVWCVRRMYVCARRMYVCVRRMYVV